MVFSGCRLICYSPEAAICEPGHRKGDELCLPTLRSEYYLSARPRHKPTSHGASLALCGTLFVMGRRWSRSTAAQFRRWCTRMGRGARLGGVRMLPSACSTTSGCESRRAACFAGLFPPQACVASCFRRLDEAGSGSYLAGPSLNHAIWSIIGSGRTSLLGHAMYW